MSFNLEKIISPTRPWVKFGDLVRLQEYYAELQEHDRQQQMEQQDKEYQLPRVDWSALFKRLFINACVEGQPEIAQWLYEEYQKLPLLAQIALRTTFHYSRAMARKKLQDYQRQRTKNGYRIGQYQRIIGWLTVVKDKKPVLLA